MDRRQLDADTASAMDRWLRPAPADAVQVGIDNNGMVRVRAALGGQETVDLVRGLVPTGDPLFDIESGIARELGPEPRLIICR